MIRIGCVQTKPVFGDVGANLQILEQSVATADADLLVFPELALTGYFFTSVSSAKLVSSEIPGPLVERLGQIAKKNNIAIITGFLEAAGASLFNSAIAFDRNGKMVGHYRKNHLFYFEKVIFGAGDLGFPVFDLEVRNREIVKVGLQICYDWRFPESTRSLAVKGAELIAIPSNIVTTTGMLHDTLRVRAFENKVIVAFSDRVGTETSTLLGQSEDLTFRGESCIINYNGDILSIGSSIEESIIYADVIPINTKSKNINFYNNIISDMRTNIYFT